MRFVLSFVLSVILGALVVEFYRHLEATRLLSVEDTYTALDGAKGPLRIGPARLFAPLRRLNHRSILGSQVNFDVVYSTDQYGRRITPQTPARSRHLLLFGDSYLFGYGVNDHETIGFDLAKKNSDVEVYNYAMPAGSMSNMLKLLQQGNLSAQVVQKKGLAFFLLYPELHTERGTGLLKDPNFGGRAPRFIWGEAGRVISERNWEQSWPAALQWYQTIFDRSYLVRSFSERLNQTAGRRDYEMAVQILLQSQEEYLHQFPLGRFVVIVAQDHPVFLEILRKKQIEFFKIQTPVGAEYFIPNDGHYSPSGTLWMADQIHKILPKF